MLVSFPLAGQTHGDSSEEGWDWKTSQSSQNMESREMLLQQARSFAFFACLGLVSSPGIDATNCTLLIVLWKLLSFPARKSGTFLFSKRWKPDSDAEKTASFEDPGWTAFVCSTFFACFGNVTESQISALCHSLVSHVCTGMPGNEILDGTQRPPPRPGRLISLYNGWKRRKATERKKKRNSTLSVADPGFEWGPGAVTRLRSELWCDGETIPRGRSTRFPRRVQGQAPQKILKIEMIRYAFSAHLAGL